MGLTWVPRTPAHTMCDKTVTSFPSVAVRYFLKNKVSPDLCNEDGLTALHQVRTRWDPCLPAPHLDTCPISLLFSCPGPSGRRGRGAAAATSERLLSARETSVSVTDTPIEPRAHVRGTYTASGDREPLSAASSLPGKGFDTQSKFVRSLTVYEARSFTPTKASVHPGDSGD